MGKKTIQKKICMLGDFSVGKTSLIRRFVEGRFDDKYLSTIGVKISRKQVERPEHQINLLIWDLAGGDNHANKLSGYLRGAAGALIVCDLTRDTTVYAFEHYSQQLRKFNESAPIVMAANKYDLSDQRQISDESLQKIADKLRADLLYTSAKTGQNVIEAFDLLADAVSK